MPEVAEGAMALPFAREMAGDWQAAAALWAELGCPYEQALALAHGDASSMRQALALLEPLEARPAVALVRHRLDTHSLWYCCPGSGRFDLVDTMVSGV